MRSGIHRLQALRAALALGAFFIAAPAVHAQWQIEPTDGSSIKFGFLVQGRAESIDVSGGDNRQDLFFRRLRILAGGKINDKLSYFFETDSPNLGRGESDGTKGASDVYIQDFVVTYKPVSDAFNLDVGMLLNEVSYNSNQSAASLMTTDYGPYSFVWSGPLDARVGRDYGVRARGYLFGDHLEYRASVMQGQRGDDSTNDFRYLGRLMFNVFEAQKGLFYSGTSLGKKHILSFGASIDHQEDYESYGVDAIWDQPIGDGGFTIQADWTSLDGDVFLTSLPEQDNLMVEAGFYFGGLKLMPFVQYSERDFDDDALNDQDQFQIGLGWMFGGHNANLKVSYTSISTDNSPDQDVIWLNFQVFKY